MLIGRSTVISLVVVFFLTFSGPALSSSTEIQSHGTTVSATQFTGDPLSGAFYNVTGIRVGSEFFLYVQGALGDGPVGPGQAGCPLDKIFLFKAPYTSAGMKGEFEFVRRISPCTTFVNENGELKNSAYGAGQVFYDGQYRLLVDRSDQMLFKDIFLGTSTNGVNWTWELFIHSTSSNEVEVVSPVLLPSSLKTCHCTPTCHCHNHWWGFFTFNSPSTQGTGQMKVDWGPEYPRGFRVSILSGGQWLIVNDNTGDFSFTPDNVWPGVSVKTLFNNQGHFELWGFKNVPHNGCAPCSGSYNNGFAGTTFIFRNVTEDFVFGPVESVDSNVRCMPSDSHVGRLYPFRVNGPSGEKFLFSSTNDQNICNPNLFGDFQGMYTVTTEVDQ